MWKRLLGAVHNRLIFRRRVRRLAAALAEAMPQGATILDIGCGDGAVAAGLMALRPDLEVIGVDVHARPTWEKRGRESFSPERTPDPLFPKVLYDGERLPFDDGAFDCAMLIDVVHHAESPERVVAEAARVARRRVVIKDHVCETRGEHRLLRLMDFVGNRPHGVGSPGRYLNAAEWDALWSRLGLAPVVRRDLPGLHPFPFGLIFRRRLHLFAVLEKFSRDPQGSASAALDDRTKRSPSGRG